MDDVHWNWVRNSYFWILLAALTAIAMLTFLARRKMRIRTILFLCVGVGILLDVLLLMREPRGFYDWRYWMAGAIVISLLSAPVLACALVVRKELALHWVLLGGLVLAAASALSLPLVSLFTVCVLGIACM